MLRWLPKRDLELCRGVVRWRLTALVLGTVLQPLAARAEDEERWSAIGRILYATRQNAVISLYEGNIGIEPGDVLSLAPRAPRSRDLRLQVKLVKTAKRLIGGAWENRGAQFRPAALIGAVVYARAADELVPSADEEASDEDADQEESEQSEESEPEKGGRTGYQGEPPLALSLGVGEEAAAALEPLTGIATDAARLIARAELEAHWPRGRRDWLNSIGLVIRYELPSRLKASVAGARPLVDLDRLEARRDSLNLGLSLRWAFAEGRVEVGGVMFPVAQSRETIRFLSSSGAELSTLTAERTGLASELQGRYRFASDWSTGLALGVPLATKLSLTEKDERGAFASTGRASSWAILADFRYAVRWRRVGVGLSLFAGYAELAVSGLQGVEDPAPDGGPSYGLSVRVEPSGD